MSADNYYLIRKHPGGKFVSLMGFMSDDDEPQVDPKRTYTFFSTPEKALEFVSTFGAVTEYGVRIHPECYETAHYENFVIGRSTEQDPKSLAERGIEYELKSLLNKYSAESISGTPDFILAEYLIDCIKAFNSAVVKRADWRGEPTEIPALIKGGQ